MWFQFLVVFIFPAWAVRDEQHDKSIHSELARFMTSECQGKLTEGLKFHDYEVLQCLGRGGDGEAYLVDKDGMQQVLKVGKTWKHECDFAKEVKKVPALKDHVTNCTDHGDMKEENIYDFIVFEKAEGKELMSVLMKAVETPPEEFPSLSIAADTINSIVDLNTQLINSGHFHLDLHPGNMFITPSKTLIAIDYGRSCTTDCPAGVISSMNHKMWLSLLLMLLQPAASSGGPAQMYPTLMQFLQNGAGNIDAKKEAENVKQHMRDAYKLPPESEADAQLTNVLVNGFAKENYMGAGVWPPAWVAELKKLKGILTSGLS